ncbi:MAG: AI-2E family transporter [Gemmatimonadales bacterium]
MRYSRSEASAALQDVAGPTRDREMRTLRVVVLLGLGTFAAALLGIMLWPFLPALVTSVVLVVLALPGHRKIRTVVRNDRAAAFLSTLAVIVVILLPIFGVSIIALQDLGTGIDWVETQLRSGFPAFGRAVVWLEGVLAAVGLSDLNVQARLGERLADVPALVVGRTFRVVSGVGGVALQVGVGLFTLFYLFRDGHRMLEAGKGLVPLPTGPMELLLRRTHEVIFAAVYGHVFVAVVQGLLGGLAFWVLGIPTPAVWGVLMGGLSLIPMIGPAFVWIPGGALLIATGATLRGVLLLLFGLLVISTIDNVIRAVFVSGRARVHPLVVFFGVLGGVLMFGAVGILVGPVLIVAAAALMEMARLSLFPDEPGKSVSADKVPVVPATASPPPPPPPQAAPASEGGATG